MTAPVWSITMTTMAAVLGDCASAGTARAHSAAAMQERIVRFTMDSLDWLFKTDDVVFERARAVGLRPQADLARHRWANYWIVRGKQIRIRRRAAAALARLAAERVLEREIAVEPCLEAGSVDRHLQLVPLASIEHELFRTVAEFHVAPEAVVEFPERDVVLGVVVADGQPVAVGLDVEQNARAAVGVARDGLELHADRAVREGADVR